MEVRLPCSFMFDWLIPPCVCLQRCRRYGQQTGWLRSHARCAAPGGDAALVRELALQPRGTLLFNMAPLMLSRSHDVEEQQGETEVGGGEGGGGDGSRGPLRI